MSRHSSRGAAWDATRLFVLNRDGRTCAYCGKTNLEGRDATVDHVTPKEAGGTDDPSNLVVACRACNGAKSNKTLTRTTWHNPRWLTAA